MMVKMYKLIRHFSCGLTWLLFPGCHKVIVMSDPRRIIDCLLQGASNDNQQPKVSNILDECKRMIERNWTIRLQHIYRKQNMVADAIAKKATSHTRGMCLFDNPPSSIMQKIINDMMGVPRARRTNSNEH